MRKVLWLVCAFALGACDFTGNEEKRASADPGSVELLGIRPGMKVAEVERILRERYPTYEISSAADQSAGRDFVSEINAKPPSTSDSYGSDWITVRFSGPHSGNQVFAIARRQQLEGRDRVLAKTLSDSLVEKYGADFNETKEDNAPARRVWLFGGQRGDSKHVCGEGDDLFTPTYFSPECGLEVAADVPGGDQDGYVSSIQIRVMDHVAGRAAEKREDAARKAFEAGERSKSLDPDRRPDL
jgi:hypothetical protein